MNDPWPEREDVEKAIASWVELDQDINPLWSAKYLIPVVAAARVWLELTDPNNRDPL